MFVGIALNQMGLACVQIDEIEEDVELSEEAKCVLEQECGIYHAETLGVYNNLAGAYDAIGRLVLFVCRFMFCCILLFDLFWVVIIGWRMRLCW